MSCGVGGSLDVGLARGEASAGSPSCRMDVLDGVAIHPSGGGISSASGKGEPGGEGGAGYVVSPLRLWLFVKDGSGLHPMLSRLLGRSRERRAPGGRIGIELGMSVGL